MPGKYLIDNFSTIEDERQGIADFDRLMKQNKVSSLLLERLKNEFD